MLKKVMIIVAIVLAALIVITGSYFAIYYAVVNKTTIKVHYDENEKYQTFEGFGASTCWYYRLFAEEASEEIQDQMLEMAYGDSGLKLDILRYNLGAGSLELKDGKGQYADPRASTDTFFDIEKYKDSTSFEDESNYDFNKDASYYGLYKKAVEKGNLKKVVIFANSPHYKLTVSGMTHGAVEKFNNLPKENFKAHSLYVLIAAKHFKEDLKAWGYEDVEVVVSPVNEPQWKWGGATDHQEGCHYDPDHLAAFYEVFTKELKAFNEANGLDIKMEMYESGDYELGITKGSKNKKYLNEFDKYEYMKEVEGIAMHSYKAETKKGMRSKYYDFLTKRYDGKKKIFMTEYCVMQGGVDLSVDMGLYSSKVLLRDLNLLNASEWTWWLSLAFGGWEDGLVYYDQEKKELWTSFRYKMYQNFMLYIDPGDVRIKADIKDSLDLGGLDSVAFKKPDGTIVMVVINDSKKTRNLNVEGLKGSSIEKIVTSESKYLASTTEKFSSTLTVDAKSVTTFVIK